MDNSVLDKKLDELTVKDSLKIQAYSIGIIAGVYAAVIGGAVAYNKFDQWRSNRKVNKNV